jgi:hypothetical protein
MTVPLRTVRGTSASTIRALGANGTGRVSEDSSLGEILSTTTHDLQDLFRLEIELAKVELQENARTAAKAGTMLGLGGLLGYLALALLCFAAAWGLAEVMPTGVAFLIVGVVVAIVAGIVAMLGKNRLQAFDAVPQQTVETIKEDIQWAEQLRS